MPADTAPRIPPPSIDNARRALSPSSRLFGLDPDSALFLIKSITSWSKGRSNSALFSASSSTFFSLEALRFCRRLFFLCSESSLLSLISLRLYPLSRMAILNSSTLETRVVCVEASLGFESDFGLASGTSTTGEITVRGFALLLARNNLFFSSVCLSISTLTVWFIASRFGLASSIFCARGLKARGFALLLIRNNLFFSPVCLFFSPLADWFIASSSAIADI
mmetsp:Transcript_8569/g.11817  ORF Transcript_8569/g.11817 Transcript_8569/m.11817 type:complete len:222 (-) Transcript_8569:315-980(-)